MVVGFVVAVVVVAVVVVAVVVVGVAFVVAVVMFMQLLLPPLRGVVLVSVPSCL